jgi:hypothetical protein
MKSYALIPVFGFMLLLNGCGTSGSGELYTEPSVDRSEITINKVAIVPNRLPLNLTDPEKWRRYNWTVAKDEFVKHKINVIDYETSINAFNKSGLPVEDTKSSRDKYAEIAEQLGVDAVVIPYYGVYSTTKTLLIATNVSHRSVATFQIYLKQQNDFVSRVDVSGENQYTTGIVTTIGMALAIGGASSSSGGESNLASVGGLLSLGGLVFDLIQILVPDDSRWETAFDEAIIEGLKPFFASLPAGNQ